MLCFGSSLRSSNGLSLFWLEIAGRTSNIYSSPDNGVIAVLSTMLLARPEIVPGLELTLDSSLWGVGLHWGESKTLSTPRLTTRLPDMGEAVAGELKINDDQVEEEVTRCCRWPRPLLDVGYVNL